MFNLLATEEDDDRRIQLLRKHCTLKSKMDELKKERAEQNKKKKLLTAALRLAQRRKKNALSAKPAPCLKRTLFRSFAPRMNRKARKRQSANDMETKRKKRRWPIFFWHVHHMLQAFLCGFHGATRVTASKPHANAHWDMNETTVRLSHFPHHSHVFPSSHPH